MPFTGERKVVRLTRSRNAVCVSFIRLISALTSFNSLLALFDSIRLLINKEDNRYLKDPVLRDFRDGDIKDSLADISKARALIGYDPTHDLQKGLEEVIPWFLDNPHKDD